MFVTGESDGGSTTGIDYATIAYDSSTGTQLWVKRFNGGANGADIATSVAVSGDGGKVFVTGRSYGGSGTGDDYVTIAYESSGGAQLWAKRWNGSGNVSDLPSALAFSGDGSKLFVTGRSFGGSATGDDFATVAYETSAGSRLWVARYNGPGNGSDSAEAVRVSPALNKVFVTGSSYEGLIYREEHATVAYNASTGAQLWSARFGLPVVYSTNHGALAVTRTRVFVTVGNYFTTIAYDSETGERLWWRSDDPAPSGGNDVATAVAVNGDGTTVFVAGWSDAGDTERALFAYTAATGAEQWASEYSNGGGGGHAAFTALAPNADGTKVFVTGSIDGPNSYDFLTVAYQA